MAIGELKQTLHGGALLRSQKSRTAWHEVAALVVAQALVARLRVHVARDAGADLLRVSFQKTVEAARVLCVVLVEAADLLSAGQLRQISDRRMNRVARQLSGRRRARSCPRAVRQPVSPWPRKRKSSNSYGEFQYEVTKINK
jgi:propanediol dehydratase small subunit